MSAVLFHCLLPLPLTFPLALPPPALFPSSHLSVRRAISKVRGARMGYERGKYGGDKHRNVWKDYAALRHSG
ncbi:hypothetical protein B0H16DRAFT_1589343, partial [Mycena metata]